MNLRITKFEQLLMALFFLFVHLSAVAQGISKRELNKRIAEANAAYYQAALNYAPDGLFQLN